MSVSVVILNLNGKKYLEEFLPFLLESVSDMPEVEIVVADNVYRRFGSVSQKHYPTIKTDVFWTRITVLQVTTALWRKSKANITCCSIRMWK